MKYKITSAFGLLLIMCSTISFCGVTPATNNSATGDTLKIVSSPSLISLVNTWAGKFGEINPAVRVSVSSASGVFNSGVNPLYIIPEDKNGSAASDFGWKMTIGHNAVVPVINGSNPMLKEIMSEGITASEFTKLLSGSREKLWSEIIPGGKGLPLHVYLAEGDDVRRSVADFTGIDPEDQSVTGFVRSEEIISVIEKDINSIGFCKLADIRNGITNELKGNIVLLPVDRNGNGRIDSFERIYDNPDELTRGIWIGKYPSALCGSIFAVSKEKPTAIEQIAFLKWIITDGSQYMNSVGYVSLAGIEKEAGLTALAGVPPNSVSDVRSAGTLTFSIILASIAVLVAIVILVTRRAARAKKSVPVASPSVSAFNENMVAVPNGILYDKSHTWTFMERDGMVRFGVDDFLQRVTGLITGIKFKEPGEFVRRGEKIMSIIKDGKQLDLYSPLSGTIRSLNTDLAIDASIINSSPFTDGWIYLIEPKNWVREMQLMFMADKYRQWLSDEFKRLRVFLSTVTRENSTCAQVIMQDGGELTENVLSDLGPEVWEDFQTRFIDVSR